MNQARLLLQIAQHDSTFTVVTHQGRRCLRGRCLYCNTALLLEMDGQRIGAATVEHLRPRHHGGDGSLPKMERSAFTVRGAGGTHCGHHRDLLQRQ